MLACIKAMPLLQVDTTGLAIILMDFLLAKEWVGAPVTMHLQPHTCQPDHMFSCIHGHGCAQVPEEEIVETIKVNPKLLRRALKYLEREQLLMSEHRRESRRSQKKDVVTAVLTANAEAARDEEDDDEAIEQLQRPHTISYYAVDFPRLYDVVQLRLHTMRKVLKV